MSKSQANAREFGYRRLAPLLIVVALVVPMLLALPATPARALVVGPGDDRVNSTPTGWWFYTGVTPSTLSSLLSSNGARLTFR